LILKPNLLQNVPGEHDEGVEGKCSGYEAERGIAQTTSSLFKGQELKWGYCLSSLGRSVEGVLGQKAEGAGGAMMISFSGGGFGEGWLIPRVKPLQGSAGLGGIVA